MGETAREIEAHIDRTREDLASNLRELDQKVRSAADWKEYFNANPALALGLAFGGGVLIGSVVMSRSQQSGADMAHAMSQPRHRSVQRTQAVETWDHIKSALLGIAAARVTQVIDEVVPGFLDQYRQVEAQSHRMA